MYMQLVIIMYNLYDKFDDYNLCPHVSVIVNVIVGNVTISHYKYTFVSCVIEVVVSSSFRAT